MYGTDFEAEGAIWAATLSGSRMLRSILLCGHACPAKERAVLQEIVGLEQSKKLNTMPEYYVLLYTFLVIKCGTVGLSSLQ